VTVQLWDFGVPVDSVDWPPLPRPLAAHCLYSSAGCGFILSCPAFFGQEIL
jgi:hypothetical protein